MSVPYERKADITDVKLARWRYLSLSTTAYFLLSSSLRHFLTNVFLSPG